MVLWTRGLLPARLAFDEGYFQFAPTSALQAGDFQGVSTGNPVYTDGAGGERWVKDNLRRVGAAAVTFKLNTHI